MNTQTLQERKGRLVATEHVNTLVRNYKHLRWLNNSKTIGKPDSLSTWYGLEELLSFLELARSHQADGIKMFYGVYPADYTNELLADRQTVVLVATRKSHDHPGAANKAIVISQNGKKEMLAFNLGEACPPFCGGMPPDFDTDLTMESDHIGLSFIEKNGNLEII